MGKSTDMNNILLQLQDGYLNMIEFNASRERYKDHCNEIITREDMIEQGNMLSQQVQKKRDKEIH